MTAPHSEPTITQPTDVSPLVIVATAPEAEALAGLPLRVVVSGVGSTAAALATASALAQAPASLVVSAGIAGAFMPSGLRVGDLAVSSRMVQADLGTRTDAGWLGLEDLGLRVGDLTGTAAHANFPAWAGAEALARRLGAGFGPMLTLNSVTGTQSQADALLETWPDALTEGMEGAGVAHAAALAGVPALELRGISNFVGPRDREGWNIGAALAAVRRGLGALGDGKWRAVHFQFCQLPTSKKPAPKGASLLLSLGRLDF